VAEFLGEDEDAVGDGNALVAEGLREREGCRECEELDERETPHERKRPAIVAARQ